MDLSVWLNGAEVHPRSPKSDAGAGEGLPARRRDRDGLIVAESVVHNITKPILGRVLRFGVVVDRRGSQVLDIIRAGKIFRAATRTLAGKAAVFEFVSNAISSARNTVSSLWGNLDLDELNRRALPATPEVVQAPQ